MTRRGVAMVLVLGAAVVMLTAAATVARLRVDRQIRSQVDRSLVQALEVTRASDAAIRAWLAAEADEVVLASDVSAPMLVVMDESIRLDGANIQIAITAWDQYGMIPRDPLVLKHVAEHIAEDVSEAGWLAASHPGLDQPGGVSRVFPTRRNPDRPGGVIATHNPPDKTRRGRGAAAVDINTNTAPRWLLDALLDQDPATRRGIRVARNQGERAPTSRRQESQDLAVRLVGTSPVWSFRIDVDSDHARVSVWSVYANRGGVWTREQQLAIAD
ncbi:MAG: hypothetical protein AAGA55_02685 [Planctomycetota bacterium]